MTPVATRILRKCIWCSFCAFWFCRFLLKWARWGQYPWWVLSLWYITSPSSAPPTLSPPSLELRYYKHFLQSLTDHKIYGRPSTRNSSHVLTLKITACHFKLSSFFPDALHVALRSMTNWRIRPRKNINQSETKKRQGRRGMVLMLQRDWRFVHVAFPPYPACL